MCTRSPQALVTLGYLLTNSSVTCLYPYLSSITHISPFHTPTGLVRASKEGGVQGA